MAENRCHGRKPSRLPGAIGTGFCLLLSAAGLAESRTLRVHEEFSTIGEAVASARAGDLIEIAEGTYSAETNGERFPIELRGRRLTIRGAGVWRTALDGGLRARLFHCADDSCVIEGMALLGGFAAGPGGAILAESSQSVFRHLRFEGCRSDSEGDAAAFVRSECRLEHALLVRNGGVGPTLLLDDGATRVTWSTFDANAGAALLLRGGRPAVESCVIARPGTGSGPSVGVVCESSLANDESMRDLIFFECAESTRPAGRGGRVGGVAGFADADGTDFRLVDRSGVLFERDPAGAFGGVNPLEQRIEPMKDSKVEPEGRIGPAIPNPFTPSTSIAYAVTARSVVDLGVFNVLGQRIRTLFAGDREPGEYREEWDGRDDLGQDMPPGVYYARITQGQETETHPLVLVR